MRRALALIVLLGAAMLARTQDRPPGPPAELPPRYDVRAKPKTYPQTTPKLALTSVIAAADANEHGYIVAHLMDPEFVDTRIVHRAKQLREAVEEDLKKLREVQRQNIGSVPKESRVPDDVKAFDEMVSARAKERAFPQLVVDVREKLAEDPQVLKDLRRFLREGTFDDAGNSARSTLPNVKDRAVYFKKVGDRWFIENRQTEDKKEPEEKKP